ncbi:MAG: glycosyltransferase family 2 protein [Flavobacteriia bacterium]|jgi:glycosyltransferase involved in cell wall biosynthesis
MPFFSIILPTYNRAHFLPKAIESVLTQTFEDWEMIIVDDGSTDNTYEIVLSYNDPRVRYIYQENQERSAARNNGIDQATGDYICFLDSDDYYLPEKLHFYRESLESIIDTKSILYDGLKFANGGILTSTPIPVQNPEYSIFEFLLLNPIGPLQVCIPATLLENQKFNPSLRIGEDIELWLRLACNVPFVPVNSYQTVAVEHDDRSVNLKRTNVAKNQLKTIESIISSTKGIRKSVKKKIISNYTFNVGKYFMFNKKYPQAIYWVSKSISKDRFNDQLKHRIFTLYYLLTCRIPREYKLL